MYQPPPTVIHAQQAHEMLWDSSTLDHTLLSHSRLQEPWGGLQLKVSSHCNQPGHPPPLLGPEPFPARCLQAVFWEGLSQAERRAARLWVPSLTCGLWSRPASRSCFGCSGPDSPQAGG